MESVWPGGARYAACFTFDLDAEYIYVDRYKNKKRDSEP